MELIPSISEAWKTKEKLISLQIKLKNFDRIKQKNHW